MPLTDVARTDVVTVDPDPTAQAAAQTLERVLLAQSRPSTPEEVST